MTKTSINIDKLKYNFRKYFILPFKILRISIVDTVRQDGVEHAGYLAFLSILSIFPFLIFLIAIIGFFGASEAGIKTIQIGLSYLPQELVKALLPRIEEITSGPPQRFITIAIIGVIWTASSSVEGCRTILNRAYRVEFPPPYIWRRFISIIEFFVISFSIVIGVFTFVIIPRLIKNMQSKFPMLTEINLDFFYLRHIATFVLLVSAVSLLYYALPNVKQKLRKTIPGSVLTVILWIILEKLFIVYLQTFEQVNFVYGSLASIIISLLFFYLISLIFIVGAEFNYHYHRTYKVFLKN